VGKGWLQARAAVVSLMSKHTSLGYGRHDGMMHQYGSGGGFQCNMMILVEENPERTRSIK